MQTWRLLQRPLFPISLDTSFYQLAHANKLQCVPLSLQFLSYASITCLWSCSSSVFVACLQGLQCNAKHWPCLDGVITVLYVLNNYEGKATIFYFLVYGFLGGKNGSVGRSEKNNFFLQKALLCQVVEKSYRYMEIVIKSDVLRNY